MLEKGWRRELRSVGDKCCREKSWKDGLEKRVVERCCWEAVEKSVGEERCRKVL